MALEASYRAINCDADVVETITTWTYLLGGWEVRFWRELPDLGIPATTLTPESHEDARKLYMGMKAYVASDEELIKFAEDLAKLPRMNAVQVSRNGTGIVIYPEWP